MVRRPSRYCVTGGWPSHPILSGGNPDCGPGDEIFQRVEHPRREGSDRLNAVVGGGENDDAQFEPGQVLLELEPLISCDERVETPSCSREKLAIGDAGPAFPLDRRNGVAG